MGQPSCSFTFPKPGELMTATEKIRAAGLSQQQQQQQQQTSAALKLRNLLIHDITVC